MEDVEWTYTSGLDEEAVAEHLRAAETGVLSLARGDDAYAIPLVHHYDGDRLLFRLGRGEDGQKWDWIETTDTATYVAYGTRETDEPAGLEGWSVIVTGRLRELEADEAAAFDPTEINERFPPIRVFDEAIEDMEVVLVELSIEGMTGRATHG